MILRGNIVIISNTSMQMRQSIYQPSRCGACPSLFCIFATFIIIYISKNENLLYRSETECVIDYVDLLDYLYITGIHLHHDDISYNNRSLKYNYNSFSEDFKGILSPRAILTYMLYFDPLNMKNTFFFPKNVIFYPKFAFFT